MDEFLLSIPTYLYNLWQVILNALRFNPNLQALVEAYPADSLSLTIGVAFVGGASLLLGQSVLLFVNRVRPGRFLASLALNGLLFTINLLVWGTSIWVIGRFLFDIPTTLAISIRLILLAAAPMVFGFFVLMPYMGQLIYRLLYVWSLLITLQVVRFQYQTNLIQTLVMVGLGWLVMLLLTATIGRPVIWIRNRIVHGVVGSPLDATPQDILMAFATAQKDKEKNDSQEESHD